MSVSGNVTEILYENVINDVQYRIWFDANNPDKAWGDPMLPQTLDNCLLPGMSQTLFCEKVMNTVPGINAIQVKFPGQHRTATVMYKDWP